MTDFSAAQAARFVGVSERGLRDMMHRGELTAVSVDPVRLDPQHVHLSLLLQQQEILSKLARRRQSPVSLALEVRARLHPKNPGSALPQHAEEDRKRRLGVLPDDGRRLFGLAALEAASLPDGSCRWCLVAEVARREPGLWAPEEFEESFAALFGGQLPCEVCRPRLYAATMAQLRAHVHAGAVRPPEGRSAPSPGQRTPAPSQPAARAVAAAAKPVQGDDGKALVGRRLREVRARLKTARRGGDVQYALRLQRQLQTLTADARLVDGRARSAAGPAGHKGCGTAVGTACRCHPNDGWVKRAQR